MSPSNAAYNNMNIFCARPFTGLCRKGLMPMTADNSSSARSEQIEAMIRLASGKLHMSPDQLKNILSDPGQTDSSLSRIGGKTAYESAMKDPGAVVKSLRDIPHARKINDSLTRGGTGH